MQQNSIQFQCVSKRATRIYIYNHTTRHSAFVPNLLQIELELYTMPLNPNALELITVMHRNTHAYAYKAFIVENFNALSRTRDQLKVIEKDK